MQYFEVHPTHPQARLVRRTAEIVRSGGVIAYPTDSAYALGCALGNKPGVDRIRSIRELDRDHNFTLICRDLSEIASYARVDNASYRLLRAHTPGPYTFILRATREVPRRLVHPRRRSVGIRVPEHAFPLALIAELGEPIMSVTLLLPGEADPPADPHDLRERLEHRLDAMIDAGPVGTLPTTVIDLTGEVPEVRRRGRGDWRHFVH